MQVPNTVRKKPTKKEVIVSNVEPIKEFEYTFKLENYSLLIFRNKLYWTEETVHVGESVISCGVLQVYDIHKLESLLKYLNSEQRIKAVKKLFNYIKASEEVAFLVMSDNNSRPILRAVLDEICTVKTGQRSNPNTGSKIKVWIY